jgi:hypothetical protein
LISFFAGLLLFGCLGIFLVKAVVKLVLFAGALVTGAGVVSVLTGGAQGALHLQSVSLLVQDLSIVSIAACGILFIFFEKSFVYLIHGSPGRLPCRFTVRAEPGRFCHTGGCRHVFPVSFKPRGSPEQFDH